MNVHLLLYPHVLATSLTLPIEMLKAGEAFALRHKQGMSAMNIQLVAKNQQSVPSRAGLNLQPDQAVVDIDESDLVIVPSIWRNPRPVVKQHYELVSWLKARWDQGATIIGVGTGNCFLAEAGLLDHRPATTHWHYAEQFKRNYPLVDLKAEYFITQSERIYCAASLNSLADIIVHIIAVNYGREAAQHVERNFSHEIRKPYEEQRYLEGAADRHADELIAQIQFWLKNNLSAESSLVEVATQFGLSQRSFTRRFKAATGMTAMQYWQQVRLEAAKDLLGASDLSLQEIAIAVGYLDQGHLTRLFKKHFSQTPSDYRLLVRKKLFG